MALAHSTAGEWLSTEIRVRGRAFSHAIFGCWHPTIFWNYAVDSRLEPSRSESQDLGPLSSKSGAGSREGRASGKDCLHSRA